jgi:hypothetical protein
MYILFFQTRCLVLIFMEICKVMTLLFYRSHSSRKSLCGDVDTCLGHYATKLVIIKRISDRKLTMIFMISVFTLPLPPPPIIWLLWLKICPFVLTREHSAISKNSKIFDELKSPYLLKEHIFCHNRYSPPLYVMVNFCEG